MPSSMNKRPRMLTEAEQKRLREFPDLIHYSNRYSDDIYEYRHVILPKAMLKAIPRDYFDPETQTLKILHEEEWRGLGITQSLGWEMYEVHQPEPHILLFKRDKGYTEKQAMLQQERVLLAQQKEQQQLQQPQQQAVFDVLNSNIEASSH